MLEGIETADRLIWETNPNFSPCGKERVNKYT
jgi:hypothetical protein